MTETTRHIVATGTVQGVFFRDWTVSTAARLGITGWVRNRRDGSVEITATGSAETLDRFAEKCSDGPEKARVVRVTSEPVDHQSFAKFERRETC